MKKKVLVFSLLLGFLNPVFSQEFSNAVYINLAEIEYGMIMGGGPVALALGGGYERTLGDHFSVRGNLLFAKSLFPSPESNNFSLLFINPEIGFRWYPRVGAVQGWFLEAGAACLYLEAQEDHVLTKENCEYETLDILPFARTGWKWVKKIGNIGLFAELGLGFGRVVYSNTFKNIRRDGMVWTDLFQLIIIKYLFWLQFGLVF